MSDPVKLAAILPEVLRDIEGRCERYRLSLAGEQENPQLRLSPDKVQHGGRVIDALAGFQKGKRRVCRPEHKSGVLAAIKGYNENKGRKQGYRRPARPRRHGHSEVGRPGCVLGGSTDKQTDMLFESGA